MGFTGVVFQGLPNQVITALFEDRERTLWVGTEGGGLSRWNGTTFESYTTKNGLVNDMVTAIAQEASGPLWIGTHSGVSRWHQGQFQTFSVTHGLPSKDDLRAPLRAVDGYAKMLEDDYAEQLDSEGRRMLGTLRSEAAASEEASSD